MKSTLVIIIVMFFLSLSIVAENEGETKETIGSEDFNKDLIGIPYPGKESSNNNCEDVIIQFPNYTCLEPPNEVFGFGARGVTFRVENKKTNITYILKRSRVNPFTVNIEEEILNKLKGQKFIINLKEFKSSHNYNYSIIEFGEEGPLTSFLKKFKFDSQKDLLKLFKQICLGLKTIHNVGYLHLDLKTDNIVMMKDGTPRIIDFDISKQIGTVAEPSGTPYYIAPEIIGTSKIKLLPSLDMYTLGILLYYMVYEKYPFNADFISGLYLLKQKGAIGFPKGIAVELLNIVKALLKREPTERLTMDQLLALIDVQLEKKEWSFWKENSYLNDAGIRVGTIRKGTFIGKVKRLFAVEFGIFFSLLFWKLYQKKHRKEKEEKIEENEIDVVMVKEDEKE